ncbi:MAG: recombinase family protein [Myxococcales bacterium]|nr:recombinase family protein [Myxococcales bacterium]
MNEPKQLRVVFYTRVSTSAQTVDNQMLQLQQVAETRRWNVVGTYSDTASGARDRRPALDEMMKAVRRGQVDLISITALDRLGRDVRHLLTVVEELRQAGVGLFSLREGIDTNSPSGRMVMVIFSGLAEFELNILRERTVHGLQRARAKGVRLGRPPRVAVDVAEARRLIADGMSKKAVALHLGVPRTSLLRALNGVSKNASKTEAVSG